MSEHAEQPRYPHIARFPQISGGQPVVEGTRIPVATLARAHQFGMDFDDILLQFPGLSPEGLHAALLYYLDHRSEMDELLQAADQPPTKATIIKG